MGKTAEGTYFTVRQEGRTETVINKSRFIGIAAPAFYEEEARARIQAVTEEFSDASSLCWGYVCGLSGQLQRFYDDHEPVGGMPILNAIRMRGLIGCVCVVVRYFGGIKLGMGGLARAFGSAAISAIEAADPGLAEKSLRYHVTYDYGFHGKMDYFLGHSEYRQEKTEFRMDVTQTVLVREKKRADFEQQINDLTDGAVLAEVIEEFYAFWD